MVTAQSLQQLQQMILHELPDKTCKTICQKPRSGLQETGLASS